MNDLDAREHGKEESRTRSRTNWAVLGFLLVAGYFLLAEHRAHIVSYLPFLLLLLCPLLHLFHGHGQHHGDSRNATRPKSDKEHRHA